MPAALPPSALVRVPPVSRELTSSWLRRLAAQYGLPPQDLLRGVINGPHPVHVTGSPKPGLELFLNSPAREAFSRFTRIPPSRLANLLPSHTHPHDRLDDDSDVRAVWSAPCHRWVTACPPCTSRAWTVEQPVLVYPGPCGHICQRHQRWLLADSERASSICLGTMPDILSSHRQHLALVRAHPHTGRVVALAAAVVWSWQTQGWKGDTVWQHRTHRLAQLTSCRVSAVAAHPLVPYPETITLTRLLIDRGFQQRLRAAATTAGPPTASTMLLQELGRRTGRPWLADWLTAHTRLSRPQPPDGGSDLLRRWLTLLANTPGETIGEELWRMPGSAMRPQHYGDRSGVLAEGRSHSVTKEARAASLTGGWEPSPPQGDRAPTPCP
ncbi:TniQ family protein [Streptomyces sp. NPDC058548]|uniref:TniQ family protein n=1 Tax=Streptomyces sp. NPDC058548 TaxID=3346545 RepID=UPI00364E693D